MIVITSAVATKAKPAVIWNRWIDIASWREWNPSLVSVVMKGGFRIGTRGTLVMTAGNAVEFEVTHVVPDVGFDIMSQLFGCTLTFQHRIDVVGGMHRMIITVVTEGLTSWFFGMWMRFLLKKELPTCLTALAELVEADQVRAEKDLYDAQFKGQ